MSDKIYIQINRRNGIWSLKKSIHLKIQSIKIASTHINNLTFNKI